ncbi:MAG: CsiV family protein [Pseudomonadota bacterium]
MFRPVLSFAAFLTAFVFGVAAADDHEIRWYDVEVVIFENVSVPTSNNTHWPLQAYVPNLNNALMLDADAFSISENSQAGDDAELVGFSTQPRLLSAETHRLTIEADAIKRSSRYRLLVHQAWRQAGTDRESAVPIHVRLGDPLPVYAITANAARDAFTALQEPAIATPELSVDAVEEKKIPEHTIPHIDNFQPVYSIPPQGAFDIVDAAQLYPFDGTVTVSLGRYLHVHTNLAITRVRNTSSANKLQTFVMQSHRRMRSRTLHYIDHPIISMLVTITPYEPDSDA